MLKFPRIASGFVGPVVRRLGCHGFTILLTLRGFLLDNI